MTFFSFLQMVMKMENKWQFHLVINLKHHYVYIPNRMNDMVH